MANNFKSLMDFSNTHISFSRPLTSYAKVQLLWSVIIRNKRFQLKRCDLKEVYCNVGCGLNILPDFLNINYQWVPGVDLCWDITKGLPFANESVEGIFIEHCLEHFSINESEKLLWELHRILKKRRIIRVVVPDGELYANLYVRSKSDKSVRFPYSKDSDDKTPMFYLNAAFSEYGHQFTYDEETLSKLLLMAGFTEIRRESFMKGRDKKLLIDQEHRKCESLYMEAIAGGNI